MAVKMWVAPASSSAFGGCVRRAEAEHGRAGGHARGHPGDGVFDDGGPGRVDAQRRRRGQVDVGRRLAAGLVHAAEHLAGEDLIQADLVQLQLHLAEVGPAGAGDHAAHQGVDLVDRGHGARDRLQGGGQGLVAAAAELEQPVIGDHEAGVGGDDGGLVAQRPADEQPETVGLADLPAELVEHRPENAVRDALRIHQDPVAVEQDSVERTGVRHDRDTTSGS
jgi:hypothetical protein